MKLTFRSTILQAQAALLCGSGALVLSIPGFAQALDAHPAPSRAAAASTQQQDADASSRVVADANSRAVADANSRAVADSRVGNFDIPARTEVLFSTEGDGTTWASGTSYKASFGADGATYIPRFGPDAPRNFPVSLTLGRATAGGTPLDLRPVSNAVRREHTMTIDRGPIDEVYELALDHVEQRFIVKQRPHVGALDLFVPLTSELELHSADGSIELRNEFGVVNYGQAFALLEDGARVPLETTVEEGAVRIHVDAAFMASARFPLVIDPIITTFAVTAFGLAPDISYDVTTDTYLIAWQVEFSSVDYDILWHLRTAGGTPVANGVADNTANDCRAPHAANLEGQDQFLLVFQRRGAPGTQWNIWGRTIQAASAVQSGSFLISTTDASGDKTNPDVGGDPFFGEAYYCVVWERTLAGESDIHGRLVQYNTVLLGASTLLIDNTIGALDSNPGISKSSGNIAAAAWTVAWQRAGASPDIYAARLSYIGAVLNPPTLVVSSANDETGPAVSSPRADGRVCLVYGEGDYFAYKLLNGVTVEASGNLSDLWPGVNPAAIYDYNFTVDTDGSRFLAGFSHTSGGFGGTLYPYVVTLGGVTPTSLIVMEGPIMLGTQPGSYSDITSKWSSGGPSHEFGIAWDGGGIDGATFQRRNGGPYSTACAGSSGGSQCPCSNAGSFGHGCANSAQASGALLAPSGDAATGATDTFSFGLSGTPTGSPAILFQGTSLTFPGSLVFGDGTLCTSGTIIRFAVKFPSVLGTMKWPGVTELPLSVQGGLPLAGGTRWYQAYYRDSASFCTSSTFNISNGVKVQWLP